MQTKITFRPLCPETWNDFEALIGPRGAYGGCWCMLWRLKRAEWEAQKGDANRLAMKAIVDSGQVPGILAYDGGDPVGWCSVAPRENFPGLARSRVLAPVDEQPVWSITCFFIRKSHRGKGVSGALLTGASQFVQEYGGGVLEGYPIDPKKDRYPTVYAWTGFAKAFRNAEFTECLRRSETRPIMRKVISKR